MKKTLILYILLLFVSQAGANIIGSTIAPTDLTFNGTEIINYKFWTETEYPYSIDKLFIAANESPLLPVEPNTPSPQYLTSAQKYQLRKVVRNFYTKTRYSLIDNDLLSKNHRLLPTGDNVTFSRY